MDLKVDSVVSIDVGYKKTGVAITSTDGSWIFSLGTIELPRFNGNKWFEGIRKLLKPHWNKVKMIVIGDPISGIDGVDNSIAHFIDQCIRMLQARTPFTITTFNERYSSQWAEEALRRIDYSDNYIKKHVHGIAAAKILKDYLFDKLLVDYEISLII